MQAIVDEKQRVMREEMKRTDILNYELGKYIGFAVNNPKQYPREPFRSKSDQPQPVKRQGMSDEEMEAKMHKLFEKSIKKDGTNS